MDLQLLLETKIDALPDGDYKLGLKAVHLHVLAAIRHYQRGKDDDQTLFTDATYRCNQAFEGSIKEAYRVLAEKAPGHKTPNDIEKFLDQAKVLRPRLLAQFKNYRQEWRNPATHDYTLDFNEDEALLAINSVTVFALVLCDQIDGKIAFTNSAREEVTDGIQFNVDADDLLTIVADMVIEFATINGDLDGSTHPGRALIRLDAELAGYLASRFGDKAKVTTEEMLSNGNFVDIAISAGRQKVVIETKAKTSPGGIRFIVERGKLAAATYLSAEEVQGVVLAVFDANKGQYKLSEQAGDAGFLKGVVKIITRDQFID